MDILDDLAAMARTRPEKLKERKRDGTKIIGYVGRFVPEELIYASGALPYLLCKGGEPEPPDAVIPYMLRFMSPYTRSQIGYHLLGIDPVIPILDLVVIQCSDCHESRLADLFEYFKIPTIRLGVPSDWKKELSRQYYYRQLTRLKDKLENITGNRITDDSFRKSIQLQNKIREALNKINTLRKKTPVPLSGGNYIRLNHYSYHSDPAELLPKLETIYSFLVENGNTYGKEAPRVLLAGHVVGIGDYVVPGLVESSGGVIAVEFLDEGVRHCECNIDTNGDLLSNLVDTYFSGRIPPSIFQPAWEERIKHIKEMITGYNIDGVIWYQLTFEEVYNLECAIVAKTMEEISIPFMKLESSYEYSREAMAPLITRVESFIESVKQRGEK
ncbi:MAG: 2-hydroxyacyl-CoA dehydratase [Dehalococcoidales bacterium]|nr:2-hydroxyacyl-CoA dehydratase [Dehalococcoidales bacterium]